MHRNEWRENKPAGSNEHKVVAAVGGRGGGGRISRWQPQENQEK